MPPQAHYLREWREHRSLRQQDLVRATGKSIATLSKVENFALPYTEKILVGYASVIDCTPADLVLHRPNDPGAGLLRNWDEWVDADVVALVRNYREVRNRKRAVAVVEAISLFEMKLTSSDENLKDAFAFQAAMMAAYFATAVPAKFVELPFEDELFEGAVDDE